MIDEREGDRHSPHRAPEVPPGAARNGYTTKDTLLSKKFTVKTIMDMSRDDLLGTIKTYVDSE